MTTHPPTRKEMAGTVPFAFFIGNGMSIVLSSEAHHELVEGDAVSLLSIALGFFDFPDQTRLHSPSPYVKKLEFQVEFP